MRERGRFKKIAPFFENEFFITFSLFKCCDVAVYTSSLRVEVLRMQSCCNPRYLQAMEFTFGLQSGGPK